MSNDFYGRTSFEIEKEIYHTQWENIRHHWDETSKGVRYLATLVLIGIFPLKFLRTTNTKVFSDAPIGLKMFIIIIIVLMGVITFFNQYNHYRRSKAARKVVVEIEKRWELYDADNKFVLQGDGDNYAYSKFTGGERRITNGTVQAFYIALITVVGIGLVWFA